MYLAISDHLRHIRTLVGQSLLTLPGVCAIVLNDSREVLLQLRADGEWHTVGGMIEPSEQPADACIREVLEETGLCIIPEAITSVYTEPVAQYPNGDQVQYVCITFLCRILGGTLHVADDESVELRFFANDDLPPLSEMARRKISDALSFAGRTAFVTH